MKRTITSADADSIARAFNFVRGKEQLPQLLRDAEVAHRAAIGEETTQRKRHAELDALRDQCDQLARALEKSRAAWETMPQQMRIDVAWSAFSTGATDLTRGIDWDDDDAHQKLVKRLDALFKRVRALSMVAATTSRTIVLPTGNQGRSRSGRSGTMPLDGLRAVARVIGPFWFDVTGRRFVKADRDDPKEKKHNRAEDFFLAVARLIDDRYSLSNCKSVLKKPGR